MACTACVTGTLHEGTPTGTVETLYGLPTYVASPPSGVTPKGTVVIIPDAFGWTLNNNRVLADSYAQKGNFRVLLPDFMDGYPLNHEMMTYMDLIMQKHESWGIHSLQKVAYLARAMIIFLPWKYSCRIGVTYPRVLAYMKKLRTEDESQPIGAAGFCWGGKHVFLLASDAEKTASGKSLITAAFTAHPSFISLPAEAEAIKIPMSVASPSDDIQIPKDQIPVLQAALQKCPAECEVKIYDGATHGFAIRANPQVPKENEQGIEAEDQAVAWFTRFFS